jgi:hypothetical protein
MVASEAELARVIRSVLDQSANAVSLAGRREYFVAARGVRISRYAGRANRLVREEDLDPTTRNSPILLLGRALTSVVTAPKRGKFSVCGIGESLLNLSVCHQRMGALGRLIRSTEGRETASVKSRHSVVSLDPLCAMLSRRRRTPRNTG